MDSALYMFEHLLLEGTRLILPVTFHEILYLVMYTICLLTVML